MPDTTNECFYVVRMHNGKFMINWTYLSTADVNDDVIMPTGNGTPRVMRASKWMKKEDLPTLHRNSGADWYRVDLQLEMIK